MVKAIDDIISLDPAEVYEFSGGEIINNVYDRIMTFDPKDFTKLVGGAAETYSVSDDGLTLTLKMRKGIKFPSGRESTARDAAFSLQRVVILDKTPAFILTQFGWTKDNVKEMVTAADDSTLVLKISKPFSPTFVLNCLTSGVGSVVDQEETMKHAQGDDLGYNWLKTNSAGSGAYKASVGTPRTRSCSRPIRISMPVPPRSSASCFATSGRRRRSVCFSKRAMPTSRAT